MPTNSKIYLDKTQQNNVEHKVETFSVVYKGNTGKDINFKYPESQFSVVNKND